MRKIAILCLLCMLLAVPLSAQEAVPSVTVSDQVSLDGTVVIDSAYSDGPGFIVIHADNGEGRPGPVIGHAALIAGWNFQIRVPIDTTQATPTLFAMLHADTGEVGVYEFGTVEGADGPVRDASDNVITPPFNVNIIRATDQFVTALNTIVISSVTAQVGGWLVVHTEADGRPGPVAGVAAVRAGTTNNILVRLDRAEPTPVLWPMLHVDTGEAGAYEFGTVEGADGPVAVNGRVATMPIWNQPHLRVADQIVTVGDAQTPPERPTLVAASVLAPQAGWLVVHTESDGGPGPVAGFAPVDAGLNRDVTVTLDMTAPTPRLWPMLHIDTGEAGVYEFGTVEGADGPVRDSADNVVTFGIYAAPSIVYAGELDDDSLVIEQALIDAPGWLVIHSDNNGAPGPVLGQAPLRPGVNRNVDVALDPAAAGNLVFPMLHYDTGEAGVYEFGSVEGADLPVQVGGAVVVGPLELMVEAMAEDMTAAACTVAGDGVNLRRGPGTDFGVAGTLSAGDAPAVTGQAQGADGFVWWNLDNGNWVRSDVVTEDGPCDSVPVVGAPAPPAPAATEEASA
jgi:hypothetical protein